MHIYRRLKQVKAISFDLDDTLYDNYPVIVRVEKEMVKWLHLHHPVSATVPLEKWHQFKKQVLAEQPELKHDVTRWRMEQIKFGLVQLGYDIDKATQASEKGIEHALWLRNQVDVPQETHQLLSALKKKYPLVAITNGNVDENQIDLGQYFEFVLRAGPDGRAKPFSDMFITTSKRLSLPPEQILHVGDHPISDVHGAKQAGYQVCWLNLTGVPANKSDKVRLLPDIEISQLSQLNQLL